MQRQEPEIAPPAQALTLHDLAHGRRRFEAMLGVPFTFGNTVDVLRNGDEVFPAMLAAIASATRSVDLLWFQWGHGEVTEQFAAALAARARAGVRVRVLLDAFGARGIDSGQLRAMRTAGCEVVFFRPLTSWRVTVANLRTHRRALVCDETVAFTGGTGLDTAWTGNGNGPSHWRDTAFRVTGPAVDGLRAAFVLDWLQSPLALSGEVDVFPGHRTDGDVAVQVIGATSHPGWNASALAVLTALELAERRVRIATPYCRVSERFHQALAAAVGRGVRVELLLTGPHVDRRLVTAQGRHEYGRLLAAGIEVWEYQPTLLHLKLVTVDSAWALVGTTNFDTRSFSLNEQVTLVVDSAAVLAVLDAHLDEDFALSRRFCARQWRDRSTRDRVVQAATSTLGKPLRGLGARGLTGRRP